MGIAFPREAASSRPRALRPSICARDVPAASPREYERSRDGMRRPLRNCRRRWGALARRRADHRRAMVATVTPLVRRYVKTAFVFLGLGLLLGGYITLSEFVAGTYPPRLFVTAHAHLLLV